MDFNLFKTTLKISKHNTFKDFIKIYQTPGLHTKKTIVQSSYACELLPFCGKIVDNYFLKSICNELCF